MKAVLINSWYKKYSTGKLVYAFHQHLIKEGYQTLVYYGHGDKVDDESVRLVSTRAGLYIHAGLCRVTGYEGCYSTNATKKIIMEIKEFAPDVVYLFNLHAYYLNEYLLLDFLKQSHISVVYMLFDEYPYLGKCCFAGTCNKFTTECSECPQKRSYPVSAFFDRSNYFFKKKKALFENWNELTLAGVEFLKNQAEKSAIARNTKFTVIDMGVELVKQYYPRDSRKLRQNLHIPVENRVVVTVGPYSDERKGIKKLVEIAKMCIDENITFINVGFDGDGSVLPSNFIGISYVSDQDELATYYSLADVYAIVSSGEAMSLTCMEALGCGTRIVGFDISGTPYSAGAEFGTFVEYNDLKAFSDALCASPKKTQDSINSCREYALSRYEVSDFVRNLEKVWLDEEHRR